MCICLPNGKFNFKFSRSHSCVGKKDGKPKRTLSLISESSEEEDARDRISLTQNNGIKSDVFNQIHGDCSTNNLGKMRPLSRDRQLPPVPDATDFSTLQINSPRKTVGKNNPISGKGDQFLSVGQLDDYGPIYDSESFQDSKNAMPSNSNKQTNQFPMTLSEDIREIDPLYSSVVAQPNRPKNHVLKIEHNSHVKDCYLSQNDNDHLYSTIVKKDFNSLRKPSKDRSSIRDYPYQSLQSLNNQAPGLPLRLYKLSELAHLTNQSNPIYPDVKMRISTPINSKSGSLRRFSQPNSVHNDSEHEPQISEESHRDIDVIRKIQSQYNTPPTKRASISDVRQLHGNIDETSHLGQDSLGTEHNPIPGPISPSRSSDNCDLYRHITVRESLASLRARNALPDNGLIFDSVASNTDTNRVLTHVYEGLYETLYYSSTEPGRPAQVPEQNYSSISTRPEIPNPLPYLGQDNYLSITDNPLSNNFHGQNTSATSMSNNVTRHSLDRASVIYATTGSEVYAEISDAYLSKQYEELPEQKPVSKDNGQINNGYVGSPGTLRVLLEIQSFRHMDSDVDVSSRSTTPLHPLARSITGVGTKSLQSGRSPDNNNHVIPYSAVIRHPWFLPQRSSDIKPIDNSTNAQSSGSYKPSNAVKPKLPQNHLAIMTPLMERSMEGSSMFLDDNRNSEQEVDSLYDLFKRDRRKDSLGRWDGRPSTVHREERMEEEDEGEYGNRKMKRIIYPCFSSNHVIGNCNGGGPSL